MGEGCFPTIFSETRHGQNCDRLPPTCSFSSRCRTALAWLPPLRFWHRVCRPRSSRPLPRSPWFTSETGFWWFQKQIFFPFPSFIFALTYLYHPYKWDLFSRIKRKNWDDDPYFSSNYFSSVAWIHQESLWWVWHCRRRVAAWPQVHCFGWAAAAYPRRKKKMPSRGPSKIQMQTC